MISSALILEFISPIILLACLIVGFVLKNLIPTDGVNKWIPLIVACLGIFLSVWYFGVFDLETLVIGGMSGLASSGLYETFKGIIAGIQDAWKNNTDKALEEKLNNAQHIEDDSEEDEACG